jgi:hypothetical protein
VRVRVVETAAIERLEEASMESWIDQLAAALGQDPVDAAETSEILAVARDVAHRVERRLTPVSTYLLGVAVGRALAPGVDRATALEEQAGRLRGLLPDPPPADVSE